MKMAAAAHVMSATSLADRALEIAVDEYPDLKAHLYASLLDKYVSEIRSLLHVKPSTVQVVKAINHYLFYEQGFAGNEENYYDPRNSYLNEVMDRKLGMPVALGIIYMEIGRRLGLSISGINFPGHFLVRIAEGGCEMIIDPYDGGILLAHEDLNERLKAIYGQNAPTVQENPDMLKEANDTEILVRILIHLKNVYSSSGNIYKLLTVMDRIIDLDPDSPHELLDRAMVYEELDYARQAVLDYQRYLELSPDAEDVDEVVSVIKDLEQKVGYLH